MDDPLALPILVMVGAIIGSCLALFVFLGRWEPPQVPEWKAPLARLIGVPPVFTPSDELTLEIEGTIVEVRSSDAETFAVSGTCFERDLTMRPGVAGSGAGWESLSAIARAELDALVRDGGEIAFGRTTLRVKGIEAAATAAERLAALTRSLGGTASPQSPKSILHRVSGAADPGRVSLVADSPGALSPPAETGALSLAPRKKDPTS